MNFQAARTNMVAQQVRPWNVVDDNVLKALSQIPRESFVPPHFINLAYSDSDIPLTNGQTMLSPKVVGRALQALNLTGKEKVLEVGTGTGYVTGCLSTLCQSVVSIEIQANLLAFAERNLSTLNARNLTLEEGDAVLGWESLAPYDVIFVTGSYPLGVPEQILSQLKLGGKLFAFSGVAPLMEAVVITHLRQSHFVTTSLFETVVPALIHAPFPNKFIF